MIPQYRENRLPTANKQLLISSVIGLDSYEVFCNILLLQGLYERCKLHYFAHQFIVCRQSTFIKMPKLVSEF